MPKKQSAKTSAAPPDAQSFSKPVAPVLSVPLSPTDDIEKLQETTDKAKVTNSKPSIRIVVTGDTFYERYIWREIDTAAATPLPYTWPGELRSARPTQTALELSGVPVHAKIFETLLTEWGFTKGTGKDFEVVPTPEVAGLAKTEEEGIELLANALHSIAPKQSLSSNEIPDLATERIRAELRNPYAVFLHELGPFPRSIPDENRHPDYIWRIKQSFGRVHPAKVPLGRVDSTDPEIEEEKDKSGQAKKDSHDMQCRILSAVEKQLHEVAKNISTQPTVVVINDRNVNDRPLRSDERDGPEIHSSIRHRLINDKERFYGLMKLVEEQTEKKKNLLILWHGRQPLRHKNPIFDALADHEGVRRITIPIVSYHCLREAGVALRFDMSYELSIRTLLDSQNNPTLHRLLTFPQLLIRFEYGMLHVTTDCEGGIKAIDLHAYNNGLQRFDAQRQGIMLGTTPLLISAVLREIIEHVQDGGEFEKFIDLESNPSHPTLLSNTRIDRAIDTGLLLAGVHFNLGFGNYDDTKDGLRIRTFAGTIPVYKELADVFSKVVKFVSPEAEEKTANKVGSDESGVGAQARTQGKTDFRLFYEPQGRSRDRLVRLSTSEKLLGTGKSAIGRRKSFSRIELLDMSDIVEQSVALERTGKNQKPGDAFDWFLRSIVKRGFDRVVARGVFYKPRAEDEIDEKEKEGWQIEPSILCPYVSFGDYISVDAQDIDSFLAFRNVVETYVNQDEFKKPLALAVFGPPGAGKSYVVKQVLQSVRGCRYDDDLEFNLSQASSSNDLSRYFHRIQDAAGKEIPIAFFDEFDSKLGGNDIGWLKHFLMPIQDGKYTEGEGTFDVKRAIFVFAGGVCESFSEFVNLFKECKDKKAPDFISRLRGFMDVQSIALSKKRSDVATSVASMRCSDGDRAAQLRRAVILRSMLLRFLPQIVDKGSKFARIEDEIVDAFLHVSDFQYGVRSMEAIVQMSRVPHNASSFLQSALPPPAQIAMHVDSAEFFRIVEEGPRSDVSDS